MKAVVVLGNQLFDPSYLKSHLGAQSKTLIFMREDRGLCTHFKYHKSKIQLFLGAMRKYADELRKKGYKVHYEELGEDKLSYEKSLAQFVKSKKIKDVCFFEVEDKFFEKRLNKMLQSLKIEPEVWESPMFLCGRDEFQEFAQDKKKLLMRTFYEQQRKNQKILVDKNLKPKGGKWSFDADNRKSLPKKMQPPPVPKFKWTKVDQEVAKLVDKHFPKHPGETEDYWIPNDRASAKKWLNDFFKNRFHDFGDYEDALAPHSDFVFHSVLTPFLNIGLLTPEYVIHKAIQYGEKNKIPINSLEGFVRQIMGWREFVRGVYQVHSEHQDKTNFWKHKKSLSQHWYKGDTGVAPLDHVIKKTLKYAYAHHIERLMVVGSLMLLLEIEPKEAHRWFMEMYADSSDWVMGPNVYGMAIFSDGGVFATKPYICGSNYYKKMGASMEGDWQDAVDGLYWSFIDKNKDFFSKNPRLSMMVRMLDKMKPERKKKIYAAARDLRAKLTQ